MARRIVGRDSPRDAARSTSFWNSVPVGTAPEWIALEVLGDLEVQRHGAVAVDDEPG